jgi:hypothetical protein
METFKIHRMPIYLPIDLQDHLPKEGRDEYWIVVPALLSGRIKFHDVEESNIYSQLRASMVGHFDVVVDPEYEQICGIFEKIGLTPLREALVHHLWTRDGYWGNKLMHSYLTRSKKERYQLIEEIV